MKCPFTAVHPREARKFCRGPRPSLSEARSPSQAAEDEGQDQRVQPWGHPGHAAAAQEVDRPKMTLDSAIGSGVSLKGWGGSGEMEGPGGTEGSAGLGARRRMQGRGFHLQGSCLGSQRLPGGGGPWQVLAGASGRDLIAGGEAQQPGPSPSPAQQGTTLPLSCAKKEGWERWGTARPAPQELGTALTPGQTDALFDCKSKRTPQLTQAAAATRASPSSPHQDLGDRAGPAARWPLPGRVRVRAASTGGPGFEWASPGAQGEEPAYA